MRSVESQSVIEKEANILNIEDSAYINNRNLRYCLWDLVIPEFLAILYFLTLNTYDVLIIF